MRHLGDAADLSSDPLLMQAVARWLAAPTPAQTTALQERLRSLEENLRYTAAFFVDRQGMVRLDSASRDQGQESALLPRPLEPPEAQALHRALERAQPVSVELHHSTIFAFPFFGVLAPLYGPDKFGISHGRITAVGYLNRTDKITELGKTAASRLIQLLPGAVNDSVGQIINWLLAHLDPPLCLRGQHIVHHQRTNQ